MAGIPVHTSAPINSNTSTVAAAVPSTTTAEPTRQQWPASVPANATATAYNATSSAQPGAVPGPAPTSTAANQYTPSNTTPTRTIPPPSSNTDHNPPPPQPGQRPSPPSQSQAAQPTSSSEPPPPPAPAPAPQSSSIAPPIQTTYTLPHPNRSIPPSRTTQPMIDLSHPPGYQQNHHASFDDRPREEFDPQNHTGNSFTSRGRSGGLLDRDPVYETRSPPSPQEDSPMWDAAVRVAKDLGKRLSTTEENIWKLVQRDE